MARRQDDKSAKPSKIPSNPKTAVFAGILIIALAFGGVGTWASTAPLDSAIIAPGSVKVDSNRKKIQHLEGGIIEEILVGDGDRVEKGDTLVRLDDTQARAELQRLLDQYYAAQAREARLIAEREDKESIDFPDELLAQKEERNLVDAIKGQRQVFEARQESVKGQIEILQQRISQLREQIQGLQAQLTAKREQVELIQQELESVQTLYEKGYAEKSRLLQLKRTAAQLKGEIGQLTSEKARAEASIGETRINILQTRREFNEKVVDALRKTQEELAALDNQIDGVRDRVDRTVVEAPTSGTVVGLDIHTEGGVIKSGQTMLYIVPRDEDLLVEARVNPADIENVNTGQNADVRFTAYQARTTPTLSGEVTYVSADTLTNEETGDPYYVARVTVPTSELSKLPGKPLQPGMPAEVMIKVGSRTAMQYLIKPISDSMTRAFREP